ncbi:MULTISPECIES: restriction endonuclease subunit S [Enterobacteriaceae]|uniref:restriction endonuclease subunit S n=1 Tax=Enterobacteriaceae TaxID=543 RepID=UPI000F85C0F6|nr:MULTISPECIES: restriction endonuclease subunit S [Enterobacteriaceae]EHY4085118.1 restriction endonuclease subunit S [Escherichia coli]RTP00836.1 restriction endonuclease subunit S [Enterobacter hormaechei]WAL51901.1 restriction endonuclease subunit S [Klebsiella variicola subsp. tropica]
MVPEGWKIRTLKDILSGSIRNGFSPIASDKETGFWVLGLGSLGDEGINVTEIKPVEPTDRVLQTKLSYGDFLVSRSNTPDKVGRSIYFRDEIENCSYPDLMMKFRIDESKAYPLFIEQKLKSSDVRAFFKNCAAGSSATMVKINKVILEKTPLLLPNINEQKKITQVLSTWDKAIATTEQLLANSQQQKKALMQQLLAGEKRLTGFKQAWSKVKVSNMGSISSGGTPDTTKKEYWDGGINWLTPTDVTSLKSRYVFSTNKKISEEGLKNSSAKMLPRGSLLICTRATIGAMAISTTEIATNQGFKNLVPNAEFSVEFLYYLFTFNIKELVRKSSGSTFLELSKSDFEKLTFLCPCIDEQHKIASVLIAADDEIAVQQQKLHYLKQEKKALMQQLLTGKRRVKVEAA